MATVGSGRDAPQSTRVRSGRGTLTWPAVLPGASNQGCTTSRPNWGCVQICLSWVCPTRQTFTVYQRCVSSRRNSSPVCIAPYAALFPILRKTWRRVGRSLILYKIHFANAFLKVWAETQLWELALCDVINNKALIPHPDLFTTTAATRSVCRLRSEELKHYWIISQQGCFRRACNDR